MTKTRRAYYGAETSQQIGSCHRDRMGRWFEVVAHSEPRICTMTGLRVVDITLRQI